MKHFPPLDFLRQRKGTVIKSLRVCFWFLLGAFLGLFFFTSFVYIYYKNAYADKVYPGVTIDHIPFGGKTEDEVRAFFAKRNNNLANKLLTFRAEGIEATVSARRIGLGYDEHLLASQAFSIGRSDTFFSNLYLTLQAYVQGIDLSPAYHYSGQALTSVLKPFHDAIDTDPIDARFTLENGRVTEFKTAKDGKKINTDDLTETLQEDIVPRLMTNKTSSLLVILPITVTKPTVTNEQANKLGITEKIGTGTSLFHGSIPNRIYNITLAASRLNGVLIKPGETFSFDKAVGDISSLSGYKQAYVISGGHTVLGDGGGVCQVSTTFFRAILNAGLPIVERHPHAYRVHYYEEDSGPGIDAAIYTPTVDLKFKNDTGHYILVQSYVDQDAERLTFDLYGTSDGRVATISDPVIVSQTPAPDPLYQDDPTLPKGQVKQIDFAAAGAVVYFTREVKRDGKVILADKYTSHYQPWQAVYLRGTKE